MQQTDEKLIAEEQKLVRNLAGLDDSVQILFSDFGWTSRVYIVNSGEIVFKFPRSEKVKEEYALETLAYKVAHVVGGVLVPEIRWEHPSNAYLGYKGVVGEPGEKVIASLSVAEKRNIGTQLGTFLKKFHRRDIADAPLISQEKEFAEYRHKLELGLSSIERYFSEDEVARIRCLVLEDYPRKMSQIGFQKGLCHGDLGYWNMICGLGGQIGIIDFGDIGYRDTSIDFAGMNDSAMLNAAIEAYGGDVSEEKIALRMKIIPILDLSFFVGKKDRYGIEKTIARIREIVLPGN